MDNNRYPVFTIGAGTAGQMAARERQKADLPSVVFKYHKEIDEISNIGVRELIRDPHSDNRSGGRSRADG